MTQDIQPFLVSADIKREHIRNKVVEGIQESFPIKSRSKTIHVSDITVQNKDYSPSDQKTAIMEGNSLFEHVKGTITVRDNATGEISDKIKNFTLAKVPWFTPRHTLIVGGNEYSVASMVRPKTGVYARKRANGILEANFNMQGASNFNVTMDPEQGEMQIEYGASKIPLYPILTRAGLTHEDISTAWGKDLADKNRQMAPKNASGVVDRLYNKVVPIYGRDVLKLTTPEDKVKEIFNRYSKATMDPEVNKVTLGMPYSSVTPHVILDASKKVLKIFKNSDEVDDRDNLDFKALYGIDDFFKERIKLDARDIARKASIKIEAKKDLRHAVQSAPFTPGLLKFINTSRLVSVPTQTNPMELIDSSMRITSLGEGGISSERAIPMEARMIHPTQIGAIDPMRTPESFQAGVDVRAAMMLHKDKQGNIYVPMYDVKNGKKLVFIRAGQIQNNVVAFPQQKLEGQVDALVNGVTRKVSASTVQYQIPHSSVMYSPATNLIPFMESNQGNRIIMGSKYQTQALSLVDRDVPNVQSISQTGKPMVTVMAETINPKSPVDGLITEIDKDYIRIKPDTGKGVVSVHYETNFPLAAKSFLHHTLNVRVGDHVKQGQMLADSNYTKDGQLALGKNLTVAYMPYRGANSNDAVVVSEGAAKKLTSEKMYKIIVARDVDMTFNKDKHQVYYGHEYKRDQYGLVDADGVVKKGAKLNAGDPVIFGLRQSTMTPDDILLGRLHKSLIKPFRNASEIWDHNHTGEVVDVVKTPKRIAITIKVKEPVVVGDKVMGSFGNKGVVSEVIPDEHMIKDESGKPIDIIVTSAGVVGRINPAQILEAAVGKVAAKTGKPVLVENFSSRDNVQYAKDLLKKHGVKDKETVFDPITGKTIPSVFVGNGYYFKAFKSTDVNYSARNIGSYDANLQPTKGGDASSKALGMMEFGALVGHNARNVLLEASTLKSQKNDEFWRALQMGYPTPPPKTSFAADKFMNMLVGAGVKVTRTGSKIALGPLTDHDTMKMSAGEILEPKLVRAKDLKPEKGGLFDPGITGGLKGDRWAHIDLAEPIVNPIFEEPVRRFLGMTGTKLTETIHNQGAGYLKTELNKIDLNKKQAELEDKSKKAKGSDLDSIVKQLKYIKSLKSLNLTPGDAYIISKIPVVPPLVRPVIPGKGGQELIYGDINPLYRDLLFVNNQLKEVKKAGTMPFEEAKLRPMLHQAVGAVYGVNDPVTTKSLARGHKGFLTYIAGAGSPKFGYFQSKLMKKTQDVAGRGTIVPDSNLGIDEVGLPEDMIWTMYEKFLIRRLVQQGYAPLEAQEMIKARHPLAKEAFMREIKERPVMMNRAPTLHRFNITGAFPVPVAGQTIRVNPFVEIAQNGDYDGDCADCTLDIGTCVDSRLVLQRLHIGEFPHNKETRKVTGNKELYEVPANTFVFGYSEKNQRVQLCEVTHFSVHHDLEMVNVTLTSGRSVKVSRDHSMFGMNPETGELSRFKAEEGIGWGTPKPRRLFVEQKKDFLRPHQDAPDMLQVPVDFNLGWVLGAWAGDGWVGYKDTGTTNYVGLAKVDPIVRHTFAQRMDCYKENASIREYMSTHDFGGGSYQSTKIHLNDTGLATWFADVTEGVRGSHNKKLPSWFMHGKEDFLLGLLSGLLDTDGTVCSVKAKAKKKPQIMATYHTVSRDLAVDVSTLLCLLGIKSRIHPYTKKESPGQEYYNVVISVPDLQKVAGQLQCATESKARVLKELSGITFDMSAPENARWDVVPISGATIQAIRSVQILSTSSCEYVALTKAVKLNRISRSVLNKIREQLGDDLVKDVCGAAWFKNVTNENIIWDFIETVVPLEERQTAWDITVPDGCTFMTSEQIVVYDTMMIHTPVSNAAIEDVKKMTLSNTLYGDKSHSDLFVVPRHESTMGITHASGLDDRNKPIHFATQADAMKAYHDSKITLGTRVTIGEQK